MKQQTLLLEVEPDDRFSKLDTDAQCTAIDLMAALIIQIFTLSEDPDHEHPAERE
jgi:hypothetical protein